MSLTKKAAAELIGTFILVIGGCGTAVFAGGSVGFSGVALAFGLTIVAAAYGVGHISGAHLNPAVSFGVLTNGRMTLKEFCVYVCSQTAGAIIAASLLYFIAQQAGIETGGFASNGYGEAFAGVAGYHQISCAGAFVTEAVLTFIFLIVILGVTDVKNSSNGKFGGLAIGLTLTLIHLISIPLTNTSVNPARSISQALFADNAFAIPQLWLFIIAPLVGAAFAGVVYRCLVCDSENCKCCKK